MAELSQRQLAFRFRRSLGVAALYAVKSGCSEEAAVKYLRDVMAGTRAALSIAKKDVALDDT